MAASTSSPSFMGCLSSGRNQAQCLRTASAAATATSDHTIRWARISTAPEGLRSGQ